MRDMFHHAHQCTILCMMNVRSSGLSPPPPHHTRLTALFPGLPGWAGTRKVKPIWILLKQETVSGGGISWAICTSAPRSRQITMPAPHHSSFLQAGCPSCHPTNSVKALKAKAVDYQLSIIENTACKMICSLQLLHWMLLTALFQYIN